MLGMIQNPLFDLNKTWIPELSSDRVSFQAEVGGDNLF
jgi:hypothetical protein